MASGRWRPTRFPLRVADLQCNQATMVAHDRFGGKCVFVGWLTEPLPSMLEAIAPMEPG